MFLTRNHTCCFTGHRQILSAHRALLPELLEKTIRGLIADGYYTFATGGALGFDTLAAEAVLALREEFSQLRLIVVAPCAEQTDGWQRNDQLRYERIREAAADFICLETAYTRDCMRRRNQMLVQMSAACVSYCMRPHSGSSQTVGFAQQENLEIIDLTEALESLCKAKI